MTLRYGLFAFALMSACSAQAQSYSAEEQEACTADALHFCQDAIPDVRRITTCLEVRKAELSPACRRMFDPTRDKSADRPGRPYRAPSSDDD